MPHTSSAKKALRQDAKRRDRNKAVKKALRSQLKKFASAAKSGTDEEKKAEFTAAVKKLDKAAVRRVIHPNAAARKKSQLARLLNAPVTEGK